MSKLVLQREAVEADDLLTCIGEHELDMNAHATDACRAATIAELRQPQAQLWTARRDGDLLAMGALIDRGDGNVEIKAMRTAVAARALYASVGFQTVERTDDVCLMRRSRF